MFNILLKFSFNLSRFPFFSLKQINCKQTLIILIFLVGVKDVLASSKGAYIGGQLGYTYIPQGQFISHHIERLTHKDIDHLTLSSSQILFNDATLGGRMFAGYQFNPYFAVEFGYYRFRMIDVNTNAKLNFLLNIAKEYQYNLPINLDAHVTVKTEVFDLMAKGILPVTKNFSIYGKLGAAYVYAKGNINIVGKVKLWKMKLSSSLHTNPSVNVVYPAASIGMSYKMYEHLSADLSWNHIQKYNSRCFPNIDLVAAGLIYHF